jgi:hypothetical protein
MGDTLSALNAPVNVTGAVKTEASGPVASQATEFLSEANGKFSATRLIMVFWALGTLALWGYVSFKATKLSDIPDSVVNVLGIVLAGKVVQKFGEKPADGS